MDNHQTINEKMDNGTNTLHGDDNHHFDWWIFPLPINNSNNKIGLNIY